MAISSEITFAEAPKSIVKMGVSSFEKRMMSPPREVHDLLRWFVSPSD